MVAVLHKQPGTFEGRICQAGRAFGKRQYTRLLAQLGYNRVEKTLHPRENCSSGGFISNLGESNREQAVYAAATLIVNDFVEIKVWPTPKIVVRASSKRV